jgi:thymidine kinase
MPGITAIIGPMYSSKSSTLLSMIERYTIARKRCLVLKYKGDTRYSKSKVATHNGREYPCIPVDNTELEKMVKDDEFKGYDVVGIDEGQFFPSLARVCDRLAKTKIVLVSGLLTTSMNTPFQPMHDLLDVADDIRFNRAVCMQCGADASRSFRLDGTKTQENIGSVDKYEARCRTCFNRGIREQTKNLCDKVIIHEVLPPMPRSQQ